MLTTKQKILCWLGRYRDDLKPETVEALQDILEEVKENKEPQPQEDIELLNEFHHETCSDWKMGLQVELLTNRLNQLIKANKK